MRSRRAGQKLEQGFTLIEVMVVVIILAVLAAVAIPAFTSESNKSKSGSEVPTMFQDLRTRLDQFHQENGRYPGGFDEATLHPATPSAAKQALLPVPAEWTAMKFRNSGSEQVYCSYTFITNTDGMVGKMAEKLGFVAPATDWYYLLARCDMDRNSAVDAYYFSSSVDPTIKSENKGR